MSELQAKRSRRPDDFYNTLPSYRQNDEKADCESHSAIQKVLLEKTIYRSSIEGESIDLGTINKVFCSKWIDDQRIIFGTKCNKLKLYDVNTRTIDAIPTLQGSGVAGVEAQNGIHAIKINPSRTLLATGARHSADIAVYRLPTLEPVCIGENAHQDWVMDMCWLDDQSLVSGSKDAKMALWRINEDVIDTVDKQDEESCPTHARITALSVKDCQAAQRLRALCFNETNKEIAVISLNGYIHIFDAETFSQKISRELPNRQDIVCIAHQPKGLYAIGCRSCTLLLDPRTLKVVTQIPARYSGCGIRSVSFQDNILTLGTGLGMLMFYDVRAGKHLECSIDSSKLIILKASKSHVFPEEDDESFQQIKYVPAIYTHSYDSTGTRLFAAGGPLPATLVGNYAGIWQ